MADPQAPTPLTIRKKKVSPAIIRSILNNPHASYSGSGFNSHSAWLERAADALEQREREIAALKSDLKLTLDTIDKEQAEAILWRQKAEQAERDALERAARTCDLIGYDWRDGGMEQKQYAAEYLAAAIRDLSPASGKEKA